MSRLLLRFMLFTGSLCHARLINSEIVKDLSVYLCSHVPTYSHANMNFFSYPVQFCVTLRSDKGIREEIRDLQSTTSLQSRVSISWRQLATAHSCRLTFKGYQTEYRISPDLGGYETCQTSISRHLFKLSQGMNMGVEHQKRIEFNSTNQECPIVSVPTDYPEYVACKFTSNEWYQVEWTSTIRYETFRNGEYGTYWANDTQNFIVKMSEEMRRNGSEHVWLKRLLKLDTKLDGCDTTNLLIHFADDWNFAASSVSLTYRIFEGSTKIHADYLGTFAVEGWREMNIPLKRIPGDHEICAQLFSSFLRHPMVLFLFLLFIPLATPSIFNEAGKGKCVPIDIDLCKDLPYNYTYSFNTILHNDQHTLQTHTEHFKPLWKTKCHPQIHFFICSVFAPMCPNSIPQAVTSCKSVCEEVKRDCFSILKEFDMEWPEPLNCEKFPEPPTLCMKPTEENDDSSVGGSGVFSVPRKPTACPSDLVDVDPHDPKSHCAFACGSDVMFSPDNKHMVRSWSVWFAAANAGVALFSFLTFAIDRKRFRFPERCVFYLSLCLFLSTLPYLFPLLLDAPIRSCHALGNGRSYLSIGTFDNSYCLASFLLNYFFSTAAALWWLMFSFTLYLSGGRKWVPEGIEACSSYVHFVAWGLSSLATIIVLIFNKVDASELTALCSVGNLNSIALLWFVIVPRTICIVIGTCFIVGGFASMCRERISFRTRGTDTSKLEKLMVKMGFFCALFMLPNIVELVCESYKFMILTQWTRVTIDCKMQSGACPRPAAPQAEIYMAAVLSSLTTGFSCLMWVLSAKTVHSWKNFIFCGMCSSAPVKGPLEPSTRPLLEPPTAPPPQPPVYMQMTTNPQTVWRPSKVV
ncbi:unnamed protein product [Caenorhabditis sp. 36 PRJEB53466]|nr:unnamed protein product [Caenorhabditis sp. 36 PRJEB53466]